MLVEAVSAFGTNTAAAPSAALWNPEYGPESAIRIMIRIMDDPSSNILTKIRRLDNETCDQYYEPGVVLRTRIRRLASGQAPRLTKPWRPPVPVGGEGGGERGATGYRRRVTAWRG